MLATQKKSQTSVLADGIKTYSVSQINELVRSRLQSDPQFRSLWLEGELFNLTKQASGHIYFSLKDRESQIRCTFFKRSNLNYQHIALQNGSQVLAFGSLSLYHPRGEYQFNVQRLLLAGEGELRLKIEALKKRLAKEGLFDPQHKKSLPYLPTTLGIATSSTGAVVKDIMRVALERYPNLNIVIAPCKVQGPQAPSSLIKALKLLQRPELEVDVIILGRGGGSFEDLLAFNDEKLLRAIFVSPIPIVSAVGHEIDSPLSDLVADAHAPTPTAAAERLVPEREALENFLNQTKIRLQVYLERYHQECQDKLRQILNSQVYLEPLSILQESWQRLYQLKRSLEQNTIISYQRACRLYEPFSYLLKALYEKNIAVKHKRFALLNEGLRNFSPLATLKRGYAVVRNARKELIRSVRNVRKTEELEIILSEGSFLAEVKEVSKKRQQAQS